MTIAYCTTCKQLVDERSTAHCPKHLGNPGYHITYISVFCDECGQHMGFCMEEHANSSIIGALCGKCSIILPNNSTKA